jgi:hypothetical protein
MTLALCDYDEMYNRLGKIQSMTSNYKKYLAAYKEGGDWSVEQFMKVINEAAKDVEDYLDDDTCV